MALTLALVEGSSLLTAVCVTILVSVRPQILDWVDLAWLVGQSAALSLCCIVAFYYNDLYDLRIVRNFSEFISRLLQSFGVAFILLSMFYAVFPDTKIANGPLISSLLIVIGFLLPLRGLSYVVMRSRLFLERLVILGVSPLGIKLIQEIEARPHARCAIVGIIDDAWPPGEPPLPYPFVGPLEHLAKIIEELRADRVIVTMAERRGRFPVRQLLDARMRGLVIEDGVEVYERLTGKLAIEALTPSFLIFSRGFSKSRFQLAFRRAVSLGTAALALLLTVPLMVLVALAIKLDSPGPIFFVQDRAGRDGRRFPLIKFRTMHDGSGGGADGIWERDDSARITRAGRWIRKLRIDEIPQFWNVLKGDMDLIGPRPEMIDNVRTMTERIPYYFLRHVVRPGVTGWAQIKHGYSVTLEDVTEKMRHDLYYIKHMSVWMDLRIIVDTVKTVLVGRGAR